MTSVRKSSNSRMFTVENTNQIHLIEMGSPVMSPNSSEGALSLGYESRLSQDNWIEYRRWSQAALDGERIVAEGVSKVS